MADDVSTGRVQWRGSGVAGEVVVGREAGDVADLTEDHRRGDRSDADDAGQGGAGGLDGFGDPRLDRLELAVERGDVVDVVGGQLSSCLAGDVARAHRREKLLRPG